MGPDRPVSNFWRLSWRPRPSCRRAPRSGQLYVEGAQAWVAGQAQRRERKRRRRPPRRRRSPPLPAGRARTFGRPHGVDDEHGPAHGAIGLAGRRWLRPGAPGSAHDRFEGSERAYATPRRTRVRAGVWCARPQRRCATVPASPARASRTVRAQRVPRGSAARRAPATTGRCRSIAVARAHPGPLGARRLVRGGRRTRRQAPHAARRQGTSRARCRAR
jgi:hypothetical protein